MYHVLNKVTQQMFRHSPFFALICLLSMTGYSAQSNKNYAA